MPPTLSALPEEAVEETAPVLLEEILEQIFLRLPPDEPACLVRASLASKLWLALLTGPRFRSRYREHHAAPPMLGFLNSTPWGSTEQQEGHPAVTETEEGHPAVPPFVSTTGFRARLPDHGWGHRDYNAWDCRHGRVLLGQNNGLLEGARRLAVWDPMTGCRRELQKPEVVYGEVDEVVYSYGLYAAAVLCAVSSCDHLACHEGPFRVVHFSLTKVVGGDDFVAQVCMSSPETCDCSKPSSDLAEWSNPCPGVSVGRDGYIEPRPPILINEALHLMLSHFCHGAVPYAQIIKYDLSSDCLSLIDAPKGGVNMDNVSILMAMEDGSLGFAHLKSKDIRLLGAVEGSDVIFVTTDLGIYSLNVKSLQDKKISNEECLVSLIPYMSFYNTREKGETCDAAH
ncbi:hypothetical protein ACQ4PT_030977 [Festuca glaucescens]